MKYNVLFASLTFLFVTQPVFAADMLVRSISVTGEAKQEIAPDQAILSGQLVSKSKELAKAKADNDKLVERVVAVAQQYEIPRAKVNASNVYISPEYTYNNATNKQEMIGYIVSRNLTITMDKLDIHERVLSALIDNKIDQISGVNFGISNPESRSDALRIQAVKNARTKAQALAEAAGAKIGKVISITTNGAVQQPMMLARDNMMAKAAMAESSVAPSLPGMTNLYESVSVTFELE